MTKMKKSMSKLRYPTVAILLAKFKYPAISFTLIILTLSVYTNCEIIVKESTEITSLRTENNSIISLTIDLHVDPLPDGSLTSRASKFEDLLDTIEWLLGEIKNTGAKLTFLSVGEFMEYCTDDEYKKRCLPILRKLYKSGGSLGTHTHQDIRTGVHEWDKQTDTSATAIILKNWSDAHEWVNKGITAALGETTDLEEINNIRGAHLPNNSSDGEMFADLMEKYKYSILESGPEEDFYGLYGHHIWNVYRPDPSNWMTENPYTSFVLVPSGPVIGLSQVHKGIMQDMTLDHVQTMFLQEFANWRYQILTGADSKVWTFGVALHVNDISERNEDSIAVRADLLAYIKWMNKNFVNKKTVDGDLVARWKGRKEVADEFKKWETNNPTSSAFSYPTTEQNDDLYPYLLPIAEHLKEANFIRFIGNKDWRGFEFEKDKKTVILAWTNDISSIDIDLSSEFEGNVTSTKISTGYTVENTSEAVLINKRAVIIFQE